jgi:hypothetical protein
MTVKKQNNLPFGALIHFCLMDKKGRLHQVSAQVGLAFNSGAKDWKRHVQKRMDYELNNWNKYHDEKMIGTHLQGVMFNFIGNRTKELSRLSIFRFNQNPSFTF